LDEISHDLCPVSRKIFIIESSLYGIVTIIGACVQVLSIQQLYRISTMYWDDKYGTHSVSSDVSFYRKVLLKLFKIIPVRKQYDNFKFKMNRKTMLSFAVLMFPSRSYPT